jgi:outer membrane beta-barrel protein
MSMSMSTSMPMSTSNRKRLLWLAAALGAELYAIPAQARTSVLEGQPAIRHKLELRERRFEITPTFEATISADFKTTYSFGAKLDYHVNDWFSIGVLGFYGVAVNTGLMDQIVSSLPTTDANYPTPSQATALSHANTMPFHGAVAATFTPWAGKLSAFGKAFVSYDIYVQGGLALAQTQNDFGGDDNATVCDQNCTDPDPNRRVFNDPRNDGPHNAGWNPGLLIGGGVHLFFGGWGALDISIRDYMFTDNPSGLDFFKDDRINDQDRRFLTHLFVGVGFSLYLPAKPAISR